MRFPFPLSDLLGVPVRSQITIIFRRIMLFILPFPRARFAVGDRVHVTGDGLGYVEEVESWHDGKMGWRYGVRWLTPDNESSCCLTFGIAEARLTKVSDSVLPQPRSRAWKQEAKNFHDAVVSAIRNHLNLS